MADQEVSSTPVYGSAGTSYNAGSGIAGQILGWGLNMFGNYLNNQWARQQGNWDRQQNYMYNEWAAQAADKRTRALYNDFYSPQALMRQYKEAGLSPSLMFGGTPGQGGHAGAQGAGIAGPQTPTFGINPMAGAEMARTLAEIKNLDADSRVKNADADTKNGLNERGRAEINLLVQNINNEYLRGEILALDQQFRQYEVAIKGATGQTEIDTANQNLANMIYQGKKLVADIKIAEAEGKIKTETADAVIQYMRDQVVLQQADILLRNIQAKAELAGIQLTNAQVAKLLNDIIVDNACVEIKKGQLKLDRDKLDRQVDQWATQNKLTKREQNIKIADITADFIVGSGANGVKMVDALIPF